MTTFINESPPTQVPWDFQRASNSVSSQFVHYYDTYAQEIWPTSTGLDTYYTRIDKGDWSGAVFEPPEWITITPGGYTMLRSDHPTNGIMYMVAINDGQLEFMRYQYMMDLSTVIEDWNQNFKNDSPISDYNLNIKNIGVEYFMGDASLFIPGSRIDTAVVCDRYEIPTGVYWLDDISFNVTNETVSLSARNNCGHKLNDQTMDELGLQPLQGKMIDVVSSIFVHAGINDFIIQPSLNVWVKYEFSPSDTILKAIQKISDSARNPNPELELCLIEHHSGRLLFGYRNWLDQYMPNSYYTFREGSDLFNRTTDRCTDGSYTRIMVTGEVKDSDPKVNHTPIFADIKNFKHWIIPKHKTKHISAPAPMTKTEFEAFADAQAEAFQYVGVNEDFTGPYRPQLYVGDVAEVLHPDGVSGTSLGLINQISQNFSIDDGFTTNFIVDSGGVSTDGDTFVIYSSSAQDNGTNRKMSIVDVIKTMSK